MPGCDLRGLRFLKVALFLRCLFIYVGFQVHLYRVRHVSRKRALAVETSQKPKVSALLLNCRVAAGRGVAGGPCLDSGGDAAAGARSSDLSTGGGLALAGVGGLMVAADVTGSWSLSGAGPGPLSTDLKCLSHECLLTY